MAPDITNGSNIIFSICNTNEGHQEQQKYYRRWIETGDMLLVWLETSCRGQNETWDMLHIRPLETDSHYSPFLTPITYRWGLRVEGWAPGFWKLF